MVQTRGPGSLPFPGRPAGTDSLPGIDHIVVLMKENHSYDNYFGMLGKGDGFTLDASGIAAFLPRTGSAAVTLPVTSGGAAFVVIPLK